MDAWPGQRLRPAEADSSFEACRQKPYEDGLNQRCVVIEFDSLEKAIATFESPEYQTAKKLLEGAAERDVRMAEGA